MNLLGETAAVGTACLWAVAVIMHTSASRMIGPFRLNLIRLPLSIAFLGLLALICVSDYSVSANAVFFLSLSGIVGLALGDTLLYKGIMQVGARTGVLIFSMAPALTAILAYVFLGETLDVWAVAGIAITLTGILWVVAEKQPDSGPGQTFSIAGGLLVFASALCQAGGMVLMKQGLTSDIHSIYATLIRMIGATAVIWPVALISGRAENPVNILKNNPGVFKFLIAGALTGPVLGVWLSLVAVKYTQAGIAATLIALEPIVMIPLAMVLEKDRPSWRALAGTIVAVAGSAVLFMH